MGVIPCACACIIDVLLLNKKSNHFGAALILTDLLVYSVNELLLLFLLDTRGYLLYTLEAWDFDKPT